MSEAPFYDDASSSESVWDALAIGLAPGSASIGLLEVSKVCRDRWRERLPRARFDAIAFEGRTTLPRAVCGVPEGAYELAILGDALARLYDPWDFLVQLRARIAPGGQVAGWLPNVRNLILLHQLAEGEFSYPAGAIGPDHLRFFTRSSTIAMFQETGYIVERLTFVRDPRCVGMVLPDTGTSNVETEKLIARNTSPLDRRELLAEGFLVLARPAHVEAPSGPGREDGEEREHAR